MKYQEMIKEKIKEERKQAERLQEIENLKNTLHNDKTYVHYKKLKEELYKRDYFDQQYKVNRKLYNVVSKIIRPRMKALENNIIDKYSVDKQKDIRDKIKLFYSDIFTSLNDKSFTSYIEAIIEVNNNINLPLEHKPSYVYNETLRITQNDFKVYSMENLDKEVSNICFLVVFFDIYVGFLKEYLLTLYCKALGLNVGINRDIDKKFDINYAIDLYVYSNETKRSLGIQLKPLSYKKMKNNYKLTESNRRMRKFKDDYKSIDFIQDHDLVEVVYILYNQNNGYEGFCTINGVSLVHIDDMINDRKYIDKDSNIDYLSLAYNISFICNR